MRAMHLGPIVGVDVTRGRNITADDVARPSSVWRWILSGDWRKGTTHRRPYRCGRRRFPPAATGWPIGRRRMCWSRPRMDNVEIRDWKAYAPGRGMAGHQAMTEASSGQAGQAGDRSRDDVAAWTTRPSATTSSPRDDEKPRERKQGHPVRARRRQRSPHPIAIGVRGKPSGRRDRSGRPDRAEAPYRASTSTTGRRRPPARADRSWPRCRSRRTEGPATRNTPSARRSAVGGLGAKAQPLNAQGALVSARSRRAAMPIALVSVRHLAGENAARRQAPTPGAGSAGHDRATTAARRW